MAESVTESRKHLALDTDWGSAMVAVSAFCIGAFVGAGLTWMTLRKEFNVTSPSWWTPLLAATFIYFVVTTSERVFRVAVLIFAVGPVSRIALWLTRASTEARLTNEIFVRWIDIGLFFGACLYVNYWLGAKLIHVYAEHMAEGIFMDLCAVS